MDIIKNSVNRKIKRWNSQVQYTSQLTAHDIKSRKKNPSYISVKVPYYRTSMMGMYQAIDIYKSLSEVRNRSNMVILDIFKKCPDKIANKSNGIISKALKIMPSLSGQLEYRLCTEGMVPDPGRVSQGVPDCILNRKQSPQSSSSKKGSNNFRIILCTDNRIGGSTMGPALMAMCEVMSMISPCEFIIQQGWLDLSATSGYRSNVSEGTVNLIKLPNNMDSSLLWFWCDSVYKDGEFSGTIAKNFLGSNFGGVSKGPEINCDLYVQDDHLVRVRSILKSLGLKNITDTDVAAYWITKLISEKFLDKDMVDNHEIMEHIGSCI